MLKKLYIKPNTKMYIPSVERQLLAGTHEDINDPGDWGGAKEGFLDEEEGNDNSWNLWK